MLFSTHSTEPQKVTGRLAEWVTLCKVPYHRHSGPAEDGLEFLARIMPGGNIRSILSNPARGESQVSGDGVGICTGARPPVTQT